MRAGKVSDGILQKVASGLVPKTIDADVVTGNLCEVISEVMSPEISGIGVGVPGLVDTESGMIYSLYNIPAWRNIRLGEILENRFGVPVYVNNDANCFAAGECFFGEGQHFSDFVGLITGTGLGAGIIKNRHLISGRNCGAGEFGVIPYLDRNMEFYASSHFFSHFYQAGARELAGRARNGDLTARDAYHVYGRHLGVVVKAIMASVDPSAIVIGGGISDAFDLYSESMWEEIKKFDFPESAERLEVVPSRLPEIAILGAAALYYNAVT